MENAWVLVLGYLFGALPFGVWVAKAHGIDILKEGSGNPGATNVKRLLGWGPALVVFALDTLKGVAPALIAHQMVSGDATWPFFAGVAAVVGHSLSPFLKFKGGKGVATGLGALLGSTPLVGLSAFGVFLVVVAISRYISLGSVVACVALVAFGYVFQVPLPVQIGYWIMGGFVFLKHLPNMKRLAAGTESRFELQGKPKASEEHPG